MVINKTIVVNDISVPHKDYLYKATAPAIVTKTKRDYFWLLPPEADVLVTAIKNHERTEFSDFADLKETLRSFFATQILGKTGLKERYSTKRLYNLRSIRAYRATEWLKLKTEYKVMGWYPEPPNPLSHTTDRTIIQHYAAKGSDNEWEARRRCFNRYNDIPALRQTWMDDWKP